VPASARVAALVLALCTSARGIDIVRCGQTVPPGETGTLLTDLTCGSGDQYAVYLEDHATLVLLGHVMTATPDAAKQNDGVGCNASCTVIGPGEISGFEYGVSTNGGLVRVSNLSVHDCEGGVAGTQVLATNVSASDNSERGFGAVALKGSGITANRNGEYGVYVFRMTAKQVTVNENGEHGLIAIDLFRGADVTVRDNGQAGILGGGRVSARQLHASGNVEGGVYGSTVTLRDSDLTGNGAFDLGSIKAPHLRRTQCGTSLVWQGVPFPSSWRVCAQD
jgi:hypothetical protein